MTIITSCAEKKHKITSSTSSTAEKMTFEEYNEKYHPVGADQQTQSTTSVSNNQPTQTGSAVPNSQPTQTAAVVSNNQVTESSSQSVDDDWISISCYPIKRYGHPWMQYDMKIKSIGDKVLITLRSKSGDKYVASKNPNYDQYSGHNIGASQDANDFNYHFTDKYGELMGFIFNF